MKIVMSAIGSRGDVQPFLALAVGLQQAGHRVTLVAPYNYTAWIEAHGVGTYPVQFNPQEFMQRPAIKAMLKSRNVVAQLRLMRDELGPGMIASLEKFRLAAADADFLVETTTGHGGVDVAGARHLPLALAFVAPFAPTRAIPSFFLPVRFSLGGTYNYLTHRLLLLAIWPAIAQPINQWRAGQGLPPWRSLLHMFNSRRSVGTPWLFGYSPSALPKPPDWEAYHHVTGYWDLDPAPDWQPPAELARFLESGPAPVYIGFGSMTNEDPDRLTRLALQALALSGQRGVLLTGWGSLAQRPPSDQVIYVDNVPHTWLFPRMAAVVHHGGAGTTGAGLRSGVPSLVVPFALDQYAWADVVVKLGVGPRVPRMQALTAEKLAQAIQTAVNAAPLRARAAALGAQVRAENGVARAVEIIERHAADFGRRL